MPKPSRGVCGRCGKAVVHPIEIKRNSWGWCEPEHTHYGSVFEPPPLFGHLYDDELKLMRVLCIECAVMDQQRPRVTTTTSSTGGHTHELLPRRHTR